MKALAGSSLMEAHIARQRAEANEAHRKFMADLADIGARYAAATDSAVANLRHARMIIGGE